MFCIALPFLILIALLILIVDRQNPIFTQNRLGIHQTEFKIVKLRTMKNNKVTKLGGVLRRTAIDELPQLINIIKTDMSFVGPRPLTRADIERLEWTEDYYKVRWEKRPGLVGPAQLSPICNRKITWFLDKSYIDKGSFSLDMKIIFSAGLILLVGKTKIQKRFYGRA